MDPTDQWYMQYVEFKIEKSAYPTGQWTVYAYIQYTVLYSIQYSIQCGNNKKLNENKTENEREK